MLAADNVIVKIDGKEVQCVESINIQFDAKEHTPRVIMTIIPTELKVSLDGQPLMQLGGVCQQLAEGHINCRKNDMPQIMPDDVNEAGMFPEHTTKE